MTQNTDNYLDTDRPFFSPNGEENVDIEFINPDIIKENELNIPYTDRPLDDKKENKNINLEIKETSFKTKKSKKSNDYKNKISIFSQFTNKSNNKCNKTTKSNILNNSEKKLESEKNKNQELFSSPDNMNQIQKTLVDKDQKDNVQNIEEKNNVNIATENTTKKHKNSSFEDETINKNLNRKIGIFTFFFYFASKNDYFIFFLAALISLLSGTSGAVFSFLVGYTIRIYAAGNSNEYIESQLPNVLILYLSVAVSFFVINYISFFLWNFIGFKSAYKFKKITIKNFLSQNQEVFDVLDKQETITYLQKKFDEMNGIGKEMGSLITNLSRISSGFLLALLVSWKLTLVLVSVAPLIIISNKFLVKFIIKAQQESFNKVIEASSFFQEILTNIKYVNSFVNYKLNILKYKEILEQAKYFMLKHNEKISFFLGCFFFLKYAQFSIAMYYSSHLIYAGDKSLLFDARLSGGDISIVIFCSIFIGFQINGVMGNLAALANGKAVAGELLGLASDYIDDYFQDKKINRIKKLKKTKFLKFFKSKKFEYEKDFALDVNEKQKDKHVINLGDKASDVDINFKKKKDNQIANYEEGNTYNKLVQDRLKNVKGKIEFLNVFFAYANDPDKLIFSNLCFKIEPGKKMGIIGDKNTGKTTLINLMQKLYEVDSGAILIDDLSIDYFKTKDLTYLIGYVGSNPLLLNMSIKDNITFFRDPIKNNITDEKIKKACKAALANRFIEHLKEKYDYVIGLEENKLTKTQMQKIAIARALLLDPKILVLDEATEFMEISKEKKLINSIICAYPDITLFISSNRVKSVKDMDSILAIKNSSNYEVGDHNQLISFNGIYSEFFNKQQMEEQEKLNLDNTTFLLNAKRSNLNTDEKEKYDNSFRLRKLSNLIKNNDEKHNAHKTNKYDDYFDFSSKKIPNINQAKKESQKSLKYQVLNMNKIFEEEMQTNNSRNIKEKIKDEDNDSIKDLKFKENDDILDTLQYQTSFFQSEKDEHYNQLDEKETNNANKISSFNYDFNKEKEEMKIPHDKNEIDKKISFDFYEKDNEQNYNNIDMLIDDPKNKCDNETIKSDFEKIKKERHDFISNEENRKENKTFSEERKNIKNTKKLDKKNIKEINNKINFKTQTLQATNEIIEKSRNDRAENKDITIISDKNNKKKTNLRNKIEKKAENIENETNLFTANKKSNNDYQINIIYTPSFTNKQTTPINAVKDKVIDYNDHNPLESKRNILHTKKATSSKFICKLSENCKKNNLLGTSNNLIKISLDNTDAPKVVKFLAPEDSKSNNHFKLNNQKTEQEEYSLKNLDKNLKLKEDQNLNYRGVVSLKTAIVPNKLLAKPNYNYKLSYDNKEENKYNNTADVNNQIMSDEIYFHNQSFLRKEENENFKNIQEEKEIENPRNRYFNTNKIPNASKQLLPKPENDNNNLLKEIKQNKAHNKDIKETNLNFNKFRSTKKLSFYSQINQSNNDLAKKQSNADNDNLNFNLYNNANNQSSLFDTNNNLLPFDINFRKYVTIDDELLLLAFEKIAENSQKNKEQHLKIKPKQSQLSIFTFLSNQKLNSYLLLFNLCLSAMVEPCFCIILSVSLTILSGDNMDELLREGQNISWIYFVISFLPLIVNYFAQFFSSKVKEEYLKNFKVALLKKLQNIHLSFFDIADNYPAAELCSKINADLANVHSIFLPSIEDMIKSFVLFFVGVTIAFTYEWRLSLIGSIFIPLLIISLMIQFKFKKELINNVNKLNREANYIFIEAIKNTKVFFGFGVQKNLYKKYKHFMKNGIIKLNRQNLITGLVYGLEEFINFLNYCFSFYFGGYFILNGSLDFGTMIKTVFAIVIFMLGLSAMHKGISEYPIAKLSVERLFSILNIEDYVLENYDENDHVENNKNKNNFVSNFTVDKKCLEEVENEIKSNGNNNLSFNKPKNSNENDFDNQMQSIDKGRISFNNAVNKIEKSKSQSQGTSKESRSTSELSNSEFTIKKEIKGKIQFKNVYFSYPERPEEIILKGINFTIEPGQNVAIVGSIDSGKNIITHLIERFYDVCHGEILIDDINIKNYDLISLRKQIGLVMQNAYFDKSESVLNNIKNGNPQASEAEVKLCIEKFDLIKLIETEKELSANNNKDNVVIKISNQDEKSNKINLNEMQKEEEKKENFLAEVNGFDLVKISIAQAKLKDPKIIIFDNCLSLFDYQIEKEIDDMIKLASRNCIGINIIDKPFSMKKYDLILFFEEGIIIEQGSHKNLMKLKGCYYKLYSETR